jgi:RimJ/RimL family protein N-acetyltransferase
MKSRTVIVPAAAAGRRPTSVREGRPVVLRDGSAVLIRQVRGTDAPLLADGFTRLSAASRQMRFLGVKKALSAAELRYFTDVDHRDHEALGALDRAGGHGVGIARYIRDADDPQAAEIAVTIVDDWQGRGLGTELLAALSDRARQEGIRRFTALADAGNVAVAGLLRNAGARLVGRGQGTVEYEIMLARGPEENRICVSRSTGPAAPEAVSAVSSPGPERMCALSRDAADDSSAVSPRSAPGRDNRGALPEVTAEPAQQVTELFQAHQLELARLAVLMVGDLATAEDVVQDAFEQLHRRGTLGRAWLGSTDLACHVVRGRGGTIAAA